MATKQRYYAEAKRLYAELRELKKEVHCSECKYCITDSWHGKLVCAKPKKNRKKCFGYEEIGVKIYAKNIHEKVYRCENYSPDGKDGRGLNDLEGDIKTFWIEAHKKSLEEWRGKYTDDDILYFLSRNQAMKKYCAKHSDG